MTNALVVFLVQRISPFFFLIRPAEPTSGEQHIAHRPILSNHSAATQKWAVSIASARRAGQESSNNSHSNVVVQASRLGCLGLRACLDFVYGCCFVSSFYQGVFGVFPSVPHFASLLRGLDPWFLPVYSAGKQKCPPTMGIKGASGTGER